MSSLLLVVCEQRASGDLMGILKRYSSIRLEVELDAFFVDPQFSDSVSKHKHTWRADTCRT